MITSKEVKRVRNFVLAAPYLIAAKVASPIRSEIITKLFNEDVRGSQVFIFPRGRNNKMNYAFYFCLSKHVDNTLTGTLADTCEVLTPRGRPHPVGTQVEYHAVLQGSSGDLFLTGKRMQEWIDFLKGEWHLSVLLNICGTKVIQRLILGFLCPLVVQIA